MSGEVKHKQAHEDTSTLAAVALRWLRRYWLVLSMVALITALHYNTAVHIHEAHGTYRRLYYFPIILAAFRGSTRGGVLAALLVCALYIPHAFGFIGFDPAPTLEKILEMVLYLAVGLLTGLLVSRINAGKQRLARTAQDLQFALDEKTAMETELVRSARLAAVGRLSAGLAHEIRNPLASIRGSAEVLADDFPNDHPKAGMLGILLEETGRLNNVLTRFLAFARTEPGERETFDLAREARAVAKVMVHRPETASVTLEAPDDSPVMVRGNREQVRQVLLNLALNGAEAAGPDGAVRLQLVADGPTWHCRVCDTGPGFSTDAVANFGTPFYTTRDSGTGLGLATSLRIVEDLGGALEIDESATGGCVVLTLSAPEA